MQPFLPRVQHLPLRLVDSLLPKQWQRMAALLVFYVCWIATFAAVLHKSSIIGDVDGYGSPLLTGCGSAFWYHLPRNIYFPGIVFPLLPAELTFQPGQRTMTVALTV